MKKVKVKAPAKINLTLEVIRRLPDGFHELWSVFFKLDNLCDELEIIFDEKKSGVKISCDDPSVPTDEKNIVWKIVEEFFKKTGERIGLEIGIKKRIPAAAGLGGGSSDGASILSALNKHFGNPLSEKELVDLAAAIGKDIPFFLQKERAALVGGAGEKVKSIKGFSKPIILVVKPTGEISTPWAYAELDKKLIFMNSSGRKNISAELLRNKNDIRAWSRFLYNDFEVVAKDKYPTVEVLKKAIFSFGALGASLSGKGPTVFGIFAGRKKAQEAARELKKYFPNCFVALS